MKKLIFTIAVVLSVGVLATSCKSDAAKNVKDAANGMEKGIENASKSVKDAGKSIKDAGNDLKEAGKEVGNDLENVGNDLKEAGKGLKENAEKALATTKYSCPMKCEKDKTYDKEGTCPKCNMDLKKMEKHSEEGHKH